MKYVGQAFDSSATRRVICRHSPISDEVVELGEDRVALMQPKAKWATSKPAVAKKMRGARSRDALAAVLMGADERDAA